MAAKTIRLDAHGSKQEEGTLDTAALPGMNIVLASDGDFDPGAGAADANLSRIVTEDALQGKTVSDTYAVGDKVFYVIPRSGDVINLLGLSGQTLNKATLVEADSAGKFVVGTGTSVQFIIEVDAGTLSADTLVAGRKI